MSLGPQLFTSATIDSLPWPETADGAYAKKFIVPLMKQGISKYIENIDAELFALLIDGMVLPIVVVSKDTANAYVCSPHTQYIAYAKHYLPKSVLAKPLFALLSFFDKQSLHMDEAVHINNWLFSTDLYPKDFSEKHMVAIIELLKKTFPRHSLIFRSFNNVTTPLLLQAAKREGCQLVASRYVYITDARGDAVFETRIVKSDLKLLDSVDYEITDEVSPQDVRQFLKLYTEVCEEKGSHLHPHLTEEYMTLLEQLLHFKVVKEKGEIKGVAGYFERGPLMMCCFFGYDKKDPSHLVLYRLLCTSLLLEAKKRGLIFHQSSGSGFYKSIRRAVGTLEYQAIYNKHLSKRRRLFWSLLKLFVNAAGPYFMKRN